MPRIEVFVHHADTEPTIVGGAAAAAAIERRFGAAPETLVPAHDLAEAFRGTGQTAAVDLLMDEEEPHIVRVVRSR